MKTASRTALPLFLLALLALFSMACQSEPAPKTANENAQALAQDSPPLPEGVEELKGKLNVTDADMGRKSLAAYEGREFELLTADGKNILLRTSETVDAERLRSFRDQNVVIHGIAFEPSMPHPMEQAPIGPDGNVEPRPGGYTVVEIFQDKAP